MRHMRLNFLRMTLFTVLGFLLFSCSDDSKTARLNIRLTDAPGDYEEVNIDIREVKVNSSDGEGEDGWKSLDVSAGVYNLLELTNGLDTLLGTADLPAGKISQVRLVLGSENTIMDDGQIYELKTPSAQQSGLKVKVNADLVEGITYTILLDFDVARSVVKTGAPDKYILKPVVRAIAEATAGAIKGTLSNPAASAAVYAIVEADTVGTTFTNDAGMFTIKGLPAGSYTISFSPAEGFVINDMEGVEVTIGVVTDLGEVIVEN